MSSGEDFILFEHFVKLLHSISQGHPRSNRAASHTVTKNSRSLNLVDRWFTQLRRYYRVIPPHTCKILFRLLFPEEDVRRRYNMKETVLARTLATEVFGLGIHARGVGSACRLIQWSEYADAAENARIGCLGIEVEKTLVDRYSHRQGESPSIQRIDTLLDELASLSGYSNLECLQPRPHRTRAAILRDLYINLDPIEAKFMTQIILKDLRPVLYPLTETHTTKTLLHYKSNSLHVLSKWEVMRAWHSYMPRIYRARATLDEAAQAVEALPSLDQISSDHDAFLPVLGIPIEIPKCRKGVKLSHALSFFQKEELWAETKYDGERMQIHVDLSQPPSRQITIFSKSKRNSTEDRKGTHPIIRASLGLVPHQDDYLQYPTLWERTKDERTKDVRTAVKCSVILDAEMVSYSESKGDIDEFWRIRSLVESTACGVRGSRHKKNIPHLSARDSQTQESNECGSGMSPEVITDSLQSNASDNGDRHLKLVFFDLMFLNGRSLLNRTYDERRAELEKIINIIPGYTSLSWRQRIDLSGGIPASVKTLASIFSQHVASYKEGLVLKGSTSIYNSLEHPWVKLKRDYIPGYGDTVDLVILGAGWNKARARELRVAPETFTTFFVAALDGRGKAGLEDDLTHCSLHFQILFTVEYGLDRAQLETLNLYIKTSEPQLFKEEMSSLPYRFRLPRGLSKPAVIFSRPLLGELFGAGFTKDAGALHYCLRFPRLTKVWRANERNWTAGSSLEDFQRIARMSIGRESRDEWASRNVDAMWGCEANPGPTDSRKVSETTRLWYEKFLRLEGLTLKKLGGTLVSAIHQDRQNRQDISNSSSRSKRKLITTDNQAAAKRQKVDIPRPVSQPMRALGSMTNILHNDTSNLSQRRGQEHKDAIAPTALVVPANLTKNLCDLPRRKANRFLNDNNFKITAIEYVPITPVSSDPSHTSHEEVVTTFTPITTNKSTSNPNSGNIVNRCSSTRGDCLERSLSPRSLLVPDTASAISSTILKDSIEKIKNPLPSPISEASWPQPYADTAIGRFIRDSYVWIHREANNKRPLDRPPAAHLIPQHRRIGVIYFLLIICGCRVEIGKNVYCRKPEDFAHVSKCVMFVKTGDQPEVQEGLAWLFRALESWRAELNEPGNKELFVFDSQMITYTSLSTFHGDVISKALWRSSLRKEN